MIIRKGLSYRTKPTQDQRQLFAQHAGCDRFVYNKLLSLNNQRYQFAEFGLHTPKLNVGAAKGLIKLWKQSDEYGFLKGVNAQCLQESALNLERAYTNCFEGRSEPPKPKKKWQSDSFRFPQAAGIRKNGKVQSGFKIEGSQVYLPKIGWVKFVKSREIEGKATSCVVKRDGPNWIISFSCEIEIPDPVHPYPNRAVGSDSGVEVFAALSTGQLIEPLNSFRQHEARLAKAQQKLSKLTKFSNNWKKQKQRVTKIHQTIANCRKDYLHLKTSERPHPLGRGGIGV